MTGFSFIDRTISWETMPPIERPTNTSASSMASARSPSGTSRANWRLYSFRSPASARSSVMIPEESHIRMFSFLAPSET